MYDDADLPCRHCDGDVNLCCATGRTNGYCIDCCADHDCAECDTEIRGMAIDSADESRAEGDRHAA